jgi:hypothetical protein
MGLPKESTRHTQAYKYGVTFLALKRKIAFIYEE